MKIPRSLKYWFKAHFLIDMVFAIPLIFAPHYTLELFGFAGENMLMARLVGAALMGIGLTSLLENNSSIESYRTMLTLKVIWSIAAIVATALSIYEGAPSSAWLILAIFAIFSIRWITFKISLKK